MDLNAVFTALNEALESKERIINSYREENASLTYRIREHEKTIAELEKIIHEYMDREAAAVEAEESDISIKI